MNDYFKASKDSLKVTIVSVVHSVYSECKLVPHQSLLVRLFITGGQVKHSNFYFNFI